MNPVEALNYIKDVIEKTTTAAIKAITSHKYTVELDKTTVTVDKFPETQKIQGKVEVTNQKEVTASIAKAHSSIVAKMGEQLTLLRTLKPLKEVRITNLKDIVFPKEIRVSNPQEQVRVSNLQEVSRELAEIKAELKKLPKSYPETKIPPYPEVKIPEFPTIPEHPKEIKVNNLEQLKSDKPQDYIPVRLTDGKKFYEALITAVSGGRLNFQRPDGQKAQARIDLSNRLEIGGAMRFSTNDIINDGNDIRYECMETSDGEWLIQKIDTSGSGTSFRYATEKNNTAITTYEGAFATYEDLSYGTVKEAL